MFWANLPIPKILFDQLRLPQARLNWGFASTAYIGAVEANPQFNQNSPCGQAANAYIATFRK